MLLGKFKREFRGFLELLTCVQGEIFFKGKIWNQPGCLPASISLPPNAKAEPERIRVERYWAFPARTVPLFGRGGDCHDGKQGRGRGNESRRPINIPFIRQGQD